MAFSKIGAAITFDVKEDVFNWLCDSERPIEVQDFTSPNILNSEFSELLSEYKNKLKPHKGVRGLHGPFFGLDLGCLLYTSPSPRDQRGSRMPSSA